jgi:hypothetical protein
VALAGIETTTTVTRLGALSPALAKVSNRTRAGGAVLAADALPPAPPARPARAVQFGPKIRKLARIASLATTVLLPCGQFIPKCFVNVDGAP